MDNVASVGAAAYRRRPLCRMIRIGLTALVFHRNIAGIGLRPLRVISASMNGFADAFASLNVPTTLAPSSQKEIPGQCFVGAEKFDVLWHGRKIAGAAQRRTRTGLLIQGSIQPPPIPLVRENWQSACARLRGNNGPSSGTRCK